MKLELLWDTIPQAEGQRTMWINWELTWYEHGSHRHMLHSSDVETSHIRPLTWLTVLPGHVTAAASHTLPFKLSCTKASLLRHLFSHAIFCRHFLSHSSEAQWHMQSNQINIMKTQSRPTSPSYPLPSTPSPLDFLFLPQTQYSHSFPPLPIPSPLHLMGPLTDSWLWLWLWKMGQSRQQSPPSSIPTAWLRTFSLCWCWARLCLPPSAPLGFSVFLQLSLFLSFLVVFFFHSNTVSLKKKIMFVCSCLFEVYGSNGRFRRGSSTISGERKKKAEREIVLELAARHRQMEEIPEHRPTASSHMEHNSKTQRARTRANTLYHCLVLWHLWYITWLHNDYSMSKSTLFWQIFPYMLIYLSNLKKTKTAVLA